MLTPDELTHINATCARPLASYLIRRPHYLRKRRFAAAFRAAGLDKVAAQLESCSEREVLVGCQSCGKSWWVVDKCRLRVCPLCAWTEAKERGNYVKAMSRHMQYPKMITLTMLRWTDDPRAGIKYLRAAFAKLRRHPVFKPCRGGAYQIELKRKPTGWHIHLHMVLDIPYTPYQRLYSAWTSILGVHHAQIDIRAATSDIQKEYVCKYATKSLSPETEAADIIAWYLATKGSRLFGTWGTWYNAKLADLDPLFFDFIPKARCPYCKREGTSFRVRDGPFIFGGKEWSQICRVFSPDGQDDRPISDITNYDEEHGIPWNSIGHQTPLFDAATPSAIA